RRSSPTFGAHSRVSPAPEKCCSLQCRVMQVTKASRVAWAWASPAFPSNDPPEDDEQHGNRETTAAHNPSKTETEPRRGDDVPRGGHRHAQRSAVPTAQEEPLLLHLPDEPGVPVLVRAVRAHDRLRTRPDERQAAGRVQPG